MGNLRKLSHLTALCIVLSRSSMAQCFGTTSTSTNTLFFVDVDGENIDR